MKNPNKFTNIFGICFIAMLCYVALNGQQLALVIQEKGLPEFLSQALHGISRVTGGEFLYARLTIAFNRVSDHDLIVFKGNGDSAQDREDPVHSAETPSEHDKTIANHVEQPQDGAPQTPALPAVEAESAAQQAPETQEIATAAQADSQEPVPAPVLPELPPSSENQAGSVKSTHAEEARVASPPPVPKAAIKTHDKKKRRATADKSIFAAPLSRRYKVLLAGDSFMEEIVLTIMRTFYNKDPNVQFIFAAKHSTGLCVSTNWNWPKKLDGFIQQHSPDIVLFFVGANDLQNIFDGKRRYSFTSAEWQKKYVEIAESMIEVALKGKATPIWIGLPIMGSEPFTKWVPLISKMQYQACQNKGVEYVDTVPTLADENGKYQIFKKTPSGDLVRIRKEDKYHVSYAGSLMIIEQVVPSIKKYILEMEKNTAMSQPEGTPQASR
ncbi:MAG: DUF459 domain-containing protein [Desulfovibrionaceae bacterium]